MCAIVSELESKADGLTKYELLSRLKPLWREHYSEAEADSICEAVAHPKA